MDVRIQARIQPWKITVAQIVLHAWGLFSVNQNSTQDPKPTILLEVATPWEIQ